MLGDLKDKTVLITGGTSGLGLDAGINFAKFGANCVLTYNWGTNDNNEVLAKFKEAGAKPPLLINIDVSKEAQTEELMAEIKKNLDPVHIFISTVAVTSLVSGVDKYSFQDLKTSLSYSTWPFYDYIKQIKKTFSSYPRYVVGISTTGVREYTYCYDYVAATKTALETLCKYLSYQLRDENINLNILRTRAIKTWSLEKTFGSDFLEFSKKYMRDEHWMYAPEISAALLGMCSGYMDSLKGQILTVDRGTSFSDDLMHLYNRREYLGLDKY